MEATTILLIILGIMLAIFLVIGIAILWNVYFAVKQFRAAGESVKIISNNFTQTSTKLKDNANKISFMQIISQAVKNRKR